MMDLHEFFGMEVKPAMGCTEPVAVALAAAVAARDFDGEPDSVALELSLNIYKNGRDVGIPGAKGLRGNRVAAAMGFFAGNPEKGLLVLEGVSDEDVAKAKAMVDAGKVSVKVRQEGPSMYIALTLRNTGCETTVIIKDRHDVIHSVVKNGETVYKAPIGDVSGDVAIPGYLNELRALGMRELWKLAGALDDELEAYMLKGVEMNLAVARQGLEGAWGLGVGATLKGCGDGADVLTRVKKMAGAAADVRMSGLPMAVMSSAGSGNHGITAVIPIAVVAEEVGASNRTLAQSVALSHLVTGFVKTYTGRLTPICGCSVAAGAGAAAGMVRILGGDASMAEHAVASLISSLMGMLCDGAKGSCGLKVSAAAGEAYAAALMALAKRGVQQDEGLVSPDMRITAKALSQLCDKAFANTDKVIVDLLQLRPEC